MYEKLTKRLRTATTLPAMHDLCQQAADVIEELGAYVQQIEELRKYGCYLQITKMTTYGQSTIAIPLPEPPKEIQTNGDSVRMMTDEELEKWYWEMHRRMMEYTDSKLFVHDWLTRRKEKND